MYDFTNKYICIVLTCNKPLYNKRRSRNTHIYEQIRNAGFEIVFLFADDKNKNKDKDIHIIRNENGFYNLTVPTEESYLNLSLKLGMAYNFLTMQHIKGILKVNDDVYHIDSSCLNLDYYNSDYLGINNDIYFKRSFYWLSYKALQYINGSSLNPTKYSEDLYIEQCLADKSDIIRYKTTWHNMEYIKYITSCIRHNLYTVEQSFCNICEDCIIMKKYNSMHFKKECGEYFNHRISEMTEQQQSAKYIGPKSVVLELGARYGTVSCVINKQLDVPTNQVSVEPDLRVQSALYDNMVENECNFHIINGFVSNSPMHFTNIDTNCGYGLTSERCESGTIPSYRLKDIELKYNLKFDTVVADCEGFLEQFFDENPQLYSQTSLILFEMDYPERCNYNNIIDNLILHKFIQLEDGFHQVWKKESHAT